MLEFLNVIVSVSPTTEEDTWQWRPNSVANFTLQSMYFRSSRLPLNCPHLQVWWHWTISFVHGKVPFE
jgi:hypothetical protein